MKQLVLILLSIGCVVAAHAGNIYDQRGHYWYTIPDYPGYQGPHYIYDGRSGHGTGAYQQGQYIYDQNGRIIGYQSGGYIYPYPN